MKRKLVIIGAKPMATGAQAAVLDFAAGPHMVLGAEGAPVIVTNLPATLMHPGAYRAPKVYAPGPGERQRLRVLRQRERQKKQEAPTAQGAPGLNAHGPKGP